ncbi:MAG: ABC transporter substrate-binding protein [Alphaproteobacteria bacterium]|nr:ABC transporter substrate-binding protein [Alphaproteobacteria bacterium]
MRGVAAGLVSLPLVLPAAVAGAADKVLRVVPHAELSILDPIVTSANITSWHGYMIYDTLFALDANFKAQPQMVGSYEVSGDGLSYSFKLRPGLKWHDGNPVTAADCVQSLKRWGAKDDEGRLAMSLTESLEPTGSDSFAWKLKEKYGNLLDNLAKLGSVTPFMMPEAVAKTDPNTQIKEAIGSGPYKFAREEWVPGSKVVYVKNKDYVPRSEPASMLAGAKIAKVDRVEWLYMPDPLTAAAALNSGEVDFIESPRIEQLPMLKGNPDVVVKVRDQLGVMILARPNHLQPPFNNKKVRQAFLAAVDQVSYMTAIIGDKDYWKACDSLLYCGTSSYSNAGAMQVGKPNLEKAKQLLAESGYKGEKVVILQPTDHPTSVAAEMTAQTLRKIGMTVELKAMAWSQLLSTRSNKNPTGEGGWSVFHTRWEGSQINPMIFSAIGGGCDKAWFGWSCSSEIERLRVAWTRETDPVKQKAILNDLHAVLVDEVPIVNVGLQVQPSAWRKDVTGVLDAPVFVLWNIDRK